MKDETFYETFSRIINTPRPKDIQDLYDKIKGIKQEKLKLIIDEDINE